LPEQKEGSEKNIETTKECENVEEAKLLFEDARKRLCDINNWNVICGN
jgi:hypothetical protein